MLKRVLAVLTIILIAVVTIYYDDMADFMKEDSCLDAGGVWLHQKKKCSVTRGQQLPAYMAEYAVVESQSGTGGEPVSKKVDGRR